MGSCRMKEFSSIYFISCRFKYRTKKTLAKAILFLTFPIAEKWKKTAANHNFLLDPDLHAIHRDCTNTDFLSFRISRFILTMISQVTISNKSKKHNSAHLNRGWSRKNRRFFIKIWWCVVRIKFIKETTTFRILISFKRSFISQQRISWEMSISYTKVTRIRISRKVHHLERRKS